MVLMDFLIRDVYHFNLLSTVKLETLCENDGQFNRNLLETGKLVGSITLVNPCWMLGECTIDIHGSIISSNSINQSDHEHALTSYFREDWVHRKTICRSCPHTGVLDRYKYHEMMNQCHMSHFFLGVLQAVPRIVGSRAVAVLAVGFIVLRLLNACQAFLMSLVWSMVTGQHPVNQRELKCQGPPSLVEIFSTQLIWLRSDPNMIEHGYVFRSVPACVSF
jgi:hypothetical protein